MTPPQANPASDSRQDPFRYSRRDTAQACDDFLDPDNPYTSQRDFAQHHGIPRSTLGYWLRQQQPEELADLEPELVAFLRGGCGERFLRRLVYAALLVFQQSGPGGIRPIGCYLHLTQLDRFVGASYGALQPLAQSMQQHLGLFDDGERPRLAALMPAKRIALTADENFHGPDPCLVGIEPMSNFILVERYTPRRDAATWTATIEEALRGLPVDVVLLCSDRARGLTCCARDGLAVLHSPDLFHGQRDLLRPVLLPLTRPLREAQKDLRDAREETQRLDEARQQSAPGPRRGRPVDYFGRMIESVGEEIKAEQRLQQAGEQLEAALQPVRGLADDYHPFDRQTGQPLEAEDLQQRLTARVEQLRQAAEQADLPQQGSAAVEQAQPLLLALVAVLAWFWTQTRELIEGLQLSVEGERLLRERLLAGYYWQAAAGRARDPEERQRLRELGERLQKEAWAEGGALARLEEPERNEVERVAWECVGLFARSSSCVEGRNGRLSLHHHGQGRLSAARLKALGVVHNYLSVREDGTTAAERFFGSKPRDLFGWLLERLPGLPRPAAKRPKKAAQDLRTAG
jgi:hypothetical protein